MSNSRSVIPFNQQTRARGIREALTHRLVCVILVHRKLGTAFLNERTCEAQHVALILLGIGEDGPDEPTEIYKSG